MKKEQISGIIGGVIAVIIIGIVLIQFSSTDEEKSFDNFNEPKDVDVDDDGIPDDEDPFIGAPRVWQTSGPFQIDKKQYVLGELVLIRINDLAPNDKGQIAFLRPTNETHYSVYITIPFDGSEKFTFNQYFKPALSPAAKICTKDQLLGNWTVVFQGTDYQNLKFEIIDEYIPGEEKYYENPAC